MSDPVVLLSTGDVVGPAGGVTDNSMVLFSGTSGKLIKGNNAVVTAAGLALLDDVNAAAQRVTLGLGTAATATLTTSATDGTAGRVMKVSDFGYGASTAPAVSLIDTNLDLVNISGIYRITGVETNTPVPPIVGHVLEVLVWNNGTFYQNYYAQNGQRRFTRNMGQAWREIALTDSPAFTGVPTAPTASVGTSTTQVATTAFVNAEIANDALSILGGTVTGRTVLQKNGQVDWPTASVEIGATDGGQAILSFNRHGVEAGTLRLNGGFYFDKSVTSSGAVNATNLFGQSQSWQLVSRAAGVAYTNDTGRPMAISIYGPQFSNSWSVFNLYISGQRVACQRNHTNYTARNWISGVVPIGATYQLNVEQTGIESWFEYR